MMTRSQFLRNLFWCVKGRVHGSKESPLSLFEAGANSASPMRPMTMRSMSLVGISSWRAREP